MLKYWKHLAMAFVACLVLVLLAQPAEAVGGQQGAFTYKLKGNGTAVITKFDWDKHDGGDVYVPRSIDGYLVTTIGKMAFTTTTIDDIVVNSNSGKAISTPGGDYLEKADMSGNNVAIILPDTITVIEEMAFFCTNITACDIPASVQIIGPGAFAGCVNIRQFSVNSGNRTYAVIDGVLFHKATKELVAFPFNHATSSGPYAKTSYIIPNGIQSIGEYAFFCCGCKDSNGLRISFPSSLVSVKDYAFWGADFSNESAPTPLYAKHIGNYAFAYSEIPTRYYASHEDNDCFIAPYTIGDYSFYKCTAPISVAYGKAAIDCENLETLGEGAFQMSNRILLIGFGESAVTHIPAYAFYATDDIIVDDLPKGLLVIGEYAFSNTGSVINIKIEPKNVTIPASVRRIDANAFFYASFGSIEFAEGSLLESIGDQAFYDFRTSAAEIILPEGVKSIGAEAFYLMWNQGVALLDVPSSVTFIGDNVVNRTKTVMQVEPGSYADIWASENGYPMQVNDTSWLFE